MRGRWSSKEAFRLFFHERGKSRGLIGEGLLAIGYCYWLLAISFWLKGFDDEKSSIIVKELSLGKIRHVLSDVIDQLLGWKLDAR